MRQRLMQITLDIIAIGLIFIFNHKLYKELMQDINYTDDNE